MNFSRKYLKGIIGRIIPAAAVIAAVPAGQVSAGELYISSVFTTAGGFTSGVEGPACDIEGNLYAVNYQRQGTIGRVTPDGECSVFVELPSGSTGNGIRFHSGGFMLIADYTGHNILKIDMETREVSIYAPVPTQYQPNDIAIGANDIVYASDPNWSGKSGNIWRIDTGGTVSLLDTIEGTTNGIEVCPGDTTLYVNTSSTKTIWAYDLSPGGDISNRRLFIKFDDYHADGMRCDIDGNLYITRQNKGAITKVSPDGEVLLDMELTGKNPSNIAFGGPDGCTCYVTMADHGNIETFRVERPGRSWQMYHDRIVYVADTINRPQNFRLDGNFPNPFNPVTTIEYTLQNETEVELSIFNMMGQEIAVVKRGMKQAGAHSVKWDASGLAGGVYFCRLKAGRFTETKKMLLLR